VLRITAPSVRCLPTYIGKLDARIRRAALPRT